MSLIQQQEEFSIAIESNKRIIYKLLHSHFNSPLDIEDGYQDCVLNARKNYSGYQSKAKFSTWLYKVSLYTIISILRKQNPRRDLLKYVNGFFDYHHLPDENDQQIKDMQWLTLVQEIRKLPLPEQELLYHYMDGRPYKYIAEATGKEENTCRVQMNRIKNKLKSIFIKP